MPGRDTYLDGLLGFKANQACPAPRGNVLNTHRPQQVEIGHRLQRLTVLMTYRKNTLAFLCEHFGWITAKVPNDETYPR